MADRDDKDREESRRIIERVGAESDASMIRRIGDHMAARDADRNDWAELWGRRIGRALGVVLLIYLLYWLFNFIVAAG